MQALSSLLKDIIRTGSVVNDGAGGGEGVIVLVIEENKRFYWAYVPHFEGVHEKWLGVIAAVRGERLKVDLNRDLDDIWLCFVVLWWVLIFLWGDEMVFSFNRSANSYLQFMIQTRLPLENQVVKYLKAQWELLLCYQIQEMIE